MPFEIPRAANDNEPDGKMLDRSATSNSMKLFAVSTALGFVGAAGAIGPSGLFVIANLIKGLFHQ